MFKFFRLEKSYNFTLKQNFLTGPVKMPPSPAGISKLKNDVSFTWNYGVPFRNLTN